MIQTAEKYRQARTEHWDRVARRMDRWRGLGVFYHRRLIRNYQFLIPPGQKVLELGCGQGELLASLRPSRGVGVDFSEEMLMRAEENHPGLQFIREDVHDFQSDERFDWIILSDLVNDLWDVQAVFQRIRKMSDPRTRVIINTYSRLWELPLFLVKKLRLGRPLLFQNWLTVEDITGLLDLADMDVIRHWEEFLCPLRVPVVEPLLNRILVRVWPFKIFAMIHIIVARPAVKMADLPDNRAVSVVVPARNEAGNIRQILARVPEMGSGTELIFVEGHSTDDTAREIEIAIADHPTRCVRLLTQEGRGKGDAVRLGFAAASGQILMILDADLTVPPEDLPRFYESLQSGKCEFTNGVRLVYPMEKEAMRFLNLLANKFFSLAFSWLLGQPIKDTLCGTKALWREDYEKIAANRSYFGDFDPFGDFDLLFGAAKLNLKILEVPIRYRERMYGSTNISRWQHGWLLLRMVLFAVRRIKFV
jgi:SAM-dependent methyltransferase